MELVVCASDWINSIEAELMMGALGNHPIVHLLYGAVLISAAEDHQSNNRTYSS